MEQLLFEEQLRVYIVLKSHLNTLVKEQQSSGYAVCSCTPSQGKSKIQPFPPQTFYQATSFSLHIFKTLMNSAIFKFTFLRLHNTQQLMYIK